MKIQKGDNVKIIVGRDQGKTGLIEYVFPNENKIIVKGIHLLKKHVKPSKKNPSGGIIDISKKIDVSNVMIICPNCGKLSRINFINSKNVKTKICSRCKKSLQVSK